VTNRPFSSLVEDGWVASSKSRFSIVVDPSAPHSPSYVGQAQYPAGFTGGREPIVLTKRFARSWDALYVSFWFKLSPGFVGHPQSGVNKIFHVWVSGSNRVTLSAQGTDQSPLEPQVRLQNVVNHGGFENLKPNLHPTRIQRGRWYRWEFLLGCNRDGASDGTAEWWIDGRKVGQYRNIAFVAAGTPCEWQQLQWAPTWGGMKGVLAAPQEMWMDHIYASGK
jgi:hypothetical protein